MPIICGFCGGAFESETSLQAHLSQEHIRVACAECGTVLVRHKLKKHMLIHNPDREMFPCQQPGCDKTYSTVRGWVEMGGDGGLRGGMMKSLDPGHL